MTDWQLFSDGVEVAHIATGRLLAMPAASNTSADVYFQPDKLYKPAYPTTDLATAKAQTLDYLISAHEQALADLRKLREKIVIQPVPKLYVGDVYRGYVWRVDTGFQHERDTTVYDVIRYEIDELGNDIGFKEQPGLFLDTLKTTRARRNCYWVTLRYEDALPYANLSHSDAQFHEVPQVFQVEDMFVLGCDNRGGYLMAHLDFED